MSIVNLAERRRAATPSADDGTCACGGRWFRPVIEDAAGGERPGAVVLDADGQVCGYAGTMRCIECGNDFKP
jgi:hypothetical protein